jgi:hypothetical protein
MSNWPTKITKENPVSPMRTSERAATAADTQLGLDDPTLFIQHGILNGKYVDAADGQTFTVDSESSLVPFHALR